MANPNTQSLTEQAFSALRSGDPVVANMLFERVIASGQSNAAIWFGRSVAYRQLNDATAERHALDQSLQLDSMFIPALIGKGDLYVRQREDRAAASFYAAAVKVAGSLTSFPDQWRPEIQRAEGAVERIAGRFEAQLREALAAGGFGQPGTLRIARALDLMLGKRKIYPQQPKHFYFPELPQIEFYPRSEFGWAGALEAETPKIRAELEAVLETEAGFVPYLTSTTDRPSLQRNPLMDDPSWSAFFLIRDGNEVAQNAARCPNTMRALQNIPLCRIADRTPSVLFSLLRPGTRIEPHHGFTNARLICHLPLIVPPGCGLRVGNETRDWRDGELLVFDDSIEHEAWNESGERRAVLLFDVWRPELSEQERGLVARLLGAARQFDGSGAPWSD